MNIQYAIAVPKVGTGSSPIGSTTRNCCVTLQPGTVGSLSFGNDMWNFAGTYFVRRCYFVLRQRKNISSTFNTPNLMFGVRCQGRSKEAVQVRGLV
jgi:hypothetical protein